MSILHHGHRRHRLAQNPLEQKFADEWQRINDQSDVLSYLHGDGNRPGYPSDETIKDSATVIQWLGSYVGQSFLRSVGFTYTDEE